MNDHSTVDVMKALADEIRLGMVRALAKESEPVPGCTLVASCASFSKLSQPAMSHHFRKLVEAGVLVEAKDGTSKSYHLNRSMLESVGITVDKL